jgi:hypothetical protein
MRAFLLALVTVVGLFSAKNCPSMQQDLSDAEKQLLINLQCIGLEPKSRNALVETLRLLYSTTNTTGDCRQEYLNAYVVIDDRKETAIREACKTFCGQPKLCKRNVEAMHGAVAVIIKLLQQAYTSCGRKLPSLDGYLLEEYEE